MTSALYRQTNGTEVGSWRRGRVRSIADVILDAGDISDAGVRKSLVHALDSLDQFAILFRSKAEHLMYGLDQPDSLSALYEYLGCKQTMLFSFNFGLDDDR